MNSILTRPLKLSPLAGVEFGDATEVFGGEAIDILDERRDYGEQRTITIGFLNERMFVVVWTQRGSSRRIISMRKANAREQARCGKRFAKIDAYELTDEDYAETG